MGRFSYYFYSGPVPLVVARETARRIASLGRPSTPDLNRRDFETSRLPSLAHYELAGLSDAIWIEWQGALWEQAHLDELSQLLKEVPARKLWFSVHFDFAEFGNKVEWRLAEATGEGRVRSAMDHDLGIAFRCAPYLNQGTLELTLGAESPGFSRAVEANSSKHAYRAHLFQRILEVLGLTDSIVPVTGDGQFSLQIVGEKVVDISDKGIPAQVFEEDCSLWFLDVSRNPWEAGSREINAFSLTSRELSDWRPILEALVAEFTPARFLEANFSISLPQSEYEVALETLNESFFEPWRVRFSFTETYNLETAESIIPALRGRESIALDAFEIPLTITEAHQATAGLSMLAPKTIDTDLTAELYMAVDGFRWTFSVRDWVGGQFAARELLAANFPDLTIESESQGEG